MGKVIPGICLKIMQGEREGGADPGTGADGC